MPDSAAMCDADINASYKFDEGNDSLTAAQYMASPKLFFRFLASKSIEGPITVLSLSGNTLRRSVVTLTTILVLQMESWSPMRTIGVTSSSLVDHYLIPLEKGFVAKSIHRLPTSPT